MNNYTYTQRIQQLNDHFRRTGQGGRKIITSGVQARGALAVLTIMHLVTSYDAFDEDNDPYDEHDFGTLYFQGELIFWKIDYYNIDMDARSPDPAEHGVTTRVLTVMMAEEY